MKTVAFTQMKDGTKAEYEMLTQLETDFAKELPDQIGRAHV